MLPWQMPSYFLKNANMMPCINSVFRTTVFVNLLVLCYLTTKSAAISCFNCTYYSLDSGAPDWCSEAHFNTSLMPSVPCGPNVTMCYYITQKFRNESSGESIVILNRTCDISYPPETVDDCYVYRVGLWTYSRCWCDSDNCNDRLPSGHAADQSRLGLKKLLSMCLIFILFIIVGFG